ncbi:DNA alkylation repair protein [Mucilaginibacter ginsenosidivorans]|uniref:DNA alkylation repair protein n=1 Tax=Mucilaginibacter ginsenosidivorans TaxID=398053 RepID=A0A5B8V0Z5_9SPHI|nr:DNA alkylation repair protein [Mucilaginibacter ginsenosidivorans]QEC65187.1 DNA alkylation repair protein [Mucilaginibacter ginsenosidivorans]
MDTDDVIDLLKQKSDPAYRKGMAHFGIDSSKALGVKVPELRQLAKTIKKDQQLSIDLWDTGIHECRILASMIGDAKQVTREQMDKWTGEFYSWDICDQACGNLFDRTPFAVEKALEYSASENEFVKRAGFVLMAEFAVHDKKADDVVFVQFFPVMEREAWDKRNFVKKAVNWALRQIGKRNKTLHQMAIATALRIALQDSKAAKWIAADALRELEKRF